MTSKSSVSRRISLVVALLALALSSTAWAAKKRVVLTRFTGKGDYAQRAAADAIARDATVVPEAAWTRAMKKLKLRKATTPDAIARVAGEAKVDGIVAGDVQRTKGGWTLKLVVTDGRTGQVSDTLIVPLKNYRLDADGKKAVAAQLAPAIAKLGGNEPAVEINPEPSPPAAAAPARPRSTDVDTEKPPMLASAPPAETRADSTSTTLEARASEDDHYSRSRAADIDVGVGVLVRSLSFDAVSGLSAAQQPRGYSGSAVPSVIVEGELYPLALTGSSSALAGLGVGFVVERVLSITSKLGTTEYDSSQTRFGGSLRYRFNLGDRPTSPTVKILAGVERLQFTIDRGSADLGFPNVSYTYVDVGANGRFPLGSPKFALFAAVRYLQVLSAGEINDTAFYGNGSAWGFDADAGFEYIFARRGAVRLGFRYQRFGLSFDGDGTLSNNRDGNPSTKDVSGATDSFVGGYATVGYLF